MLNLKPKIHPRVKKFLEEEITLLSLVKGLGSPLNIIFPEIFTENINKFKEIIDVHKISAELFYAHKTNQSQGLVKQASYAEIGIDVASVNELKNALSNGFHPERIEITGPKNQDLLHLAISQKILLNVDSISELEQIVDLLSENIINTKQKILIRLTDFSSSSYGIESRPSRFGISVSEIDKVFSILAKNASILDFIGFAFHLDTNEIKEKVLALDSCLKLFEKAYSVGLSPKVINIGGGFRQVFIENKDGWEDYVQSLKLGLSGKGEALAWHGINFGLRLEGSQTQGIPIFHKYGDTKSGISYFEELLSSNLLDSENRQVDKTFQENMIKLFIEPGKSLVDHTGITVCSIISIKKLTNKDYLISLDIKRDNLVPVDQEVMIDPVILYQKKKNYEIGEFGVFFGGNLCLERDMVYNHKTFLEKLPKIGDLVIFINTAAYQMDLSASEALMQPKPKKVIITQTSKKICWYLDEIYTPWSKS